MHIKDIHTICKQSGISFVPTLIRHWYWRLVRHANILLSPHVHWFGKGRINLNGRLMAGFDNSILSHPNTPTTIKMFGNLIVTGIARIQRGCRIEVGEGATLELNNCFINNNCLILCEHGLTIGAETAIGWNTQICDADYHNVIRCERHSKRGGGNVRCNITIGRHVLIGNNCFIYKGVHIADECVVASNSVVKNSLLEPNTLYAGVPAKAICIIENWT